MADPIR